MAELTPSRAAIESAKRRREEARKKRLARKGLGSGMAGRAADELLKRRERLRDL